MMRRSVIFCFLVCLFVGCSLVSAADQEIPNLVGNWSGTSAGHDRAHGYDGPSNWTYVLSVTDQKDRAFNGTVYYTSVDPNGTSGSIGYSGVIGSDMESFYIAEYAEGYCFGQIIDSDHLELIYLESGDDASASIDWFTRENP